jgi:diguanylate cyclase (GGDEF)-like protein/PAS domain S-box-containing protein
MLGGLTVVSRSLILSDYARLERQSITQNVQRASHAFTEAVMSLHERTADWAAWDDTFAFMQTRDPKYIESNLIPDTLRSLQVEMVLYITPSGKLSHAATLQRVPNVRNPAPQSVLHSLGFPQSAQTLKPDTEFMTVIAGQDTPLMVSLRPIVKSDLSGKPRGWLLMARHFDQAMLARLRHQTRLNIQLEKIHSPKLSADFRATLGELHQSSNTAIQIVNNQQIAGFAMIKGRDNEPLYILKTTEKRAIWQRGLAGVATLLKFILGACVVFAVVILILLDRAILRRLSALGEQLENIAEQQSRQVQFALPRVSIEGTDELNALADRVNGLLLSLETYTHRLQNSQQELRERNALLENVVEGIARMDADGCFVAANTAYAGMLDYAADELLGMHWTETVYVSDRAKMAEVLRMLHHVDKIELDIQGIGRDGRIFHQQNVLVAIQDEAGALAGCYVFAKDISDRTELEAQIAHQAYHDALTGLPNRARFMERLSAAQTNAKKNQGLLAVVFIDLDNFKIVNDSLGHEAGDALLGIVAERLLDAVRVGDIVARLGGDEFTLLMEGMPSVNDILLIVEQIVQSLRAPILLPQRELFASASIGIAYTDGHENLSEDTLLRYADIAMYHAKSLGKSGYALFDPSMNAHVVERMEIETGLRLALERDEFVVHYQPLVNLETGRIIGAEALTRWISPERGLVSPSVFIPIAEEAGLIAAIGYVVLEKACRQWKRWAEETGENFDFTMNVNLSGRQLQRLDVVERVKELLNAIQMPPQKLKLEITESVIMENLDDAIAKLHQFREFGIQLAIDDFGTGYSSMSTLSTFPVNTVKIDKAFVQQLGMQEEANAVVAALIMLSKTLKMDVTAEGVETKEQVIQLQSMGCNVGQGYYFARPVSPDQFTEALKNGLPFRLETDSLHRSHIEQLLQQYLPSKRAA